MRRFAALPFLSALVLATLVLAIAGYPSMTMAQSSHAKTRGKTEYERICGECHDLGVGTGNPRTRAQWAAVVEDMAAMGAAGTKAELQLVVDYLSANFGK